MLVPSVYKMCLGGDTQYITKPGQFINIALDGKFLRRPISVCDYDEKTITIIYKTVGEGTLQLSKMQPGEMLDCLTGDAGDIVFRVHVVDVVGAGLVECRRTACREERHEQSTYFEISVFHRVSELLCGYIFNENRTGFIAGVRRRAVDLDVLAHDGLHGRGDEEILLL